MGARTRLGARVSDINIDMARHAQYANVLAFLESIKAGSDDRSVLEEVEEAIRCLDAVYVTGGRVTVGPIDGKPEA